MLWSFSVEFGLKSEIVSVVEVGLISILFSWWCRAVVLGVERSGLRVSVLPELLELLLNWGELSVMIGEVSA